LKPHEERGVCTERKLSAGLDRLGLQKTSLLDFPGEVAATVFTQGCNLRCPYCHNPELAVPPASRPQRNHMSSAGDAEFEDSKIGIVELDEFLSRRTKVLGGVCITGGEPLIHEDIGELARLIRSHGLKVKLDTNGTYPERLEELLCSGLLDYVAMDLKTAPELYGRLLADDPPDSLRPEVRTGLRSHEGLSDSTGPRDPSRAAGALGERIRSSVEVLRRQTTPYELRTTAAPGIVGPQEIADILPLLSGAQRYVLKAFRGGETLDPGWKDAEPPSDELMNRMCAMAAESGVPCVLV